MPGIFGAVGASSEVRDLLKRDFLSRWPDTDVLEGREVVLGAHSFRRRGALYRTGSGDLVAVDGEWSLYEEAAARLRGEGRVSGFNTGSAERELASAGNVAVIETNRNQTRLIMDPAGVFPLYYTQYAGGLLFASLLKPLARLVEAGRDDIGLLEFLRKAYTVGPKTVFADIYRLLPGQTLLFVDGNVRIEERSTAWTEWYDIGMDAAVERAWTSLERTIQRALAPDGAALMMSGGWDSRTLLAAAHRVGNLVTCYSHGDTDGRELHIVKGLCQAVGMPCRMERIDERILDPDSLEQGFTRTENVVSPHWHRAGQLLAQDGFNCITAGVYGEILGGHYGPTMLAGRFGKMWDIARFFLGLPGGIRGGDISPLNLLKVPVFGRHWYLRADYEASLDRPRDRMNAAIEDALKRLKQRGVHRNTALVEAFISEHRGCQDISAQLLSCRAFADIALPFASRELYVFSTRVPLQRRIHNNLNRAMLARYAPSFLKFPMAATLVPADFPLFVQEISRAARKTYEGGRNWLSRKTKGTFSRPRLGWVDFFFLRDGRALHRLCDDLRSDLWDHDAIHERINRLEKTHNPAVFFPFFDQFLKVYTADLFLR